MRLDINQIHKKRKECLKKISDIRKREILVMASDLTNTRAQISIDYSDLLPVKDQLENLKGEDIDLILETPGGGG